MSNRTGPFLEVGRELSRAGKIVCFANAASAVKPRRPPAKPSGDGPLRVVETEDPPLAAFVQLPGIRPLGLWSPSLPACPVGTSIGIYDIPWDGLVFDLLELWGR